MSYNSLHDFTALGKKDDLEISTGLIIKISFRKEFQSRRFER